MKTWLLTFGLLTAPFAFAADYGLDDPAILGKYKLAKAKKDSEVQSVELIYNHDNELMVYTDRNGNEYVLHEKPDKNGVIFDSEDEPNCDGDEPHCYYDSRTTITLTKTTVRGREIPQLILSITQSNAWDETGQDDFTSTYILNWSKPLAYAIPFYLNAKDPREWQVIQKNCRQTVEPTEGLGGLNSPWEVCAASETKKYRDTLEKAWPYYAKDNFADKSKVKRITANDIKRRVFRKVISIINKYDDRELKVSKDKLREQVRLQQDYVLANYDTFYHYQYFDTAYVIAVDTKQKLIFEMRIDTKK